MEIFSKLKFTVALIIMTFSVYVAANGVNFCFAEDSAKPDQLQILKKTCLQATITAIKMELSHYKGGINQKNNSEESSKVKALKDDLEEYQKMDVSDYTLPYKMVSTMWVESEAKNGSLLYVERMSKSGPWYPLAGIVGDDYSILQPGMKKEVVFYAVYYSKGRYSFLDVTYVCVAEVR